MKTTSPFLLTAVMLCGFFFTGPAFADDGIVEQAVFYVQ